MGRHHEQQSLALLGEVHQRSGGDERWGERHAGQKNRILVFPIDRIHDLSFIGPEPSFKTLLRQMFRQGGAPGTGPDDSYAVNCLHVVDRYPGRKLKQIALFVRHHKFLVASFMFQVAHRIRNVKLETSNLKLPSERRSTLLEGGVRTPLEELFDILPKASGL